MNCWLLIVEKARLHPEWAETVQKWYNWLHEETTDEEKRREEEHKKLVPWMISGGARGAGYFHRLHQNELRGEVCSFGRVGGTCETYEEM